VPTGFTQAFAEAIIKEAEHDDRIVAITAAMPGPTGLLPFQDRFPDRFFDVGIAEQHAVTAAAGMAMGGLRPVVAIYSTFMNRAWDQVVYDVALHRLPVVFCVDRAGITGDDGASHHGLFDMMLFTKVPGITMLAPSSARELQVMLHDALELCDGPVVIRYPRGASRVVSEHDVGTGLRANKRCSGNEVCILAVGKLVATAEKAAERLASEGISVTVWDARVIQPLDPEMLRDAATHPIVVTIEDGLRDGGVGEMIANELSDSGCRVKVLGIPSKFLPHGKPDRILANLGLDADGLVASIHRLLG